MCARACAGRSLTLLEPFRTGVEGGTGSVSGLSHFAETNVTTRVPRGRAGMESDIGKSPDGATDWDGQSVEKECIE